MSYNIKCHNITCLTVLFGLRPRPFRTTNEYQEIKAPPPSSIAPTPTSQLSRWPDTNTTFSGVLDPFTSATVFLDKLSFSKVDWRINLRRMVSLRSYKNSEFFYSDIGTPCTFFVYPEFSCFSFLCKKCLFVEWKIAQ